MAAALRSPSRLCLSRPLLSLRSLLNRSLGRCLLNLRSVRLLGAATTCSLLLFLLGGESGLVEINEFDKCHVGAVTLTEA